MSKIRIGLQIGFFLAALACLYIGQKTTNNQLIGLGLFCLGPILLIFGGHTITTRWLGFWPKKYRSGEFEIYRNQYERYTGLSAQLWGVYFILIGLLVMAFGVGYAVYPGGPEKLWAALLGTHWGVGIVLGLIGLLVALDGFIRVLAGSAGRNIGLPTGVGNCLDRFVGGVVFLLGMALIGIAAVVTFIPGLLNDLFGAIVGLFR
jgi:hypothetical protein